VAGLVVAGAAVPALAQTVPTPGAVLQQTAPAPAPVAAPTAPIVLPARKARKTGSTLPIPVRRLVITGNHLIATARLEKLVAPAEGRTLTLDQLDAVVHRITDAYHQEGYPVAYAYLPAQTVRAGVIRIDVVEPRYDRIEVTGRSRFSAAQVRRTLGVRAGQPVAEGPLSRGLLLLQQTPGLRVNGMLLPGAAPGTSSLKIARKDAPLLSGSFTLTNHGNAYTGRALGTLAVTAADPFGQGSALSANATVSQSTDLKAGGIDAISPDLGNGLRFGAYGSWTDYRLGGPFAGLDQHGQARQLGADLSYPLVLAPGRQLGLRVDLTDTRLSQETLSTGAVTRQHLRIASFSLSGAVSGAKGGVTSGRVALNLGTLSLAPAAARAADAAGPNAAGSFALLRFRLAQDQPLGGGYALRAALSGAPVTLGMLTLELPLDLLGPGPLLEILRGQHRAATRAAAQADLPEGATIHDAAAGPGVLALALAAAAPGATVSASDPAAPLAALAVRNLPAHGLAGALTEGQGASVLITRLTEAAPEIPATVTRLILEPAPGLPPAALTAHLTALFAAGFPLDLAAGGADLVVLSRLA